MGFILGLFQVNIALAVAMIPVVAILGLVFLPMMLGLAVTTIVFGGIGHAVGYLAERLGDPRKDEWGYGLVVGGVGLVVLVWAFVTFYAPDITTGGLMPAQGAVRQAQFASNPYATLASVSGVPSNVQEPGIYQIGYHDGTTYPPKVCPSGCAYGCLPNTAECKPLPSN